MRVLVSGTWDREVAEEAAARLEEAGHEPVDRLEVWASVYGTVEVARMAAPNDLLRESVRALLDCQGLAMVEGWKSSKTTKHERLLASRLGLVAEDLEVFFQPDAFVKRRVIYECSVCGKEFTRGRGRPPRVLLCNEHGGSKRGKVSAVYEAPERDSAYSDRLDQLWAFAKERHAIYVKRQAGLPPPWTADTMLATRFFTNVYRAIDPGTLAFRAWLKAKREAMARNKQPAPTVNEVAFWALAYRATNHEDLLLRRGLPERDPKSVSEWVAEIKSDELAGYQVQPSTHRAKGYQHLRATLTGACWDLDIASQATAEDGWYHVKAFYGLGVFYATQVISDVLDDETSPWDRDSYVPTALGSTRALYWLSQGEHTKSSSISRKLIASDLDFAYRELHDDQPDIEGGWPLTYVDVEHTLCEFSKYVDHEPRGGKLRVFAPVRP